MKSKNPKPVRLCSGGTNSADRIWILGFRICGIPEIPYQ
jgi:hypothetical protein